MKPAVLSFFATCMLMLVMIYSCRKIDDHPSPRLPTGNIKPIADAGPDLFISLTGQRSVSLDGSKSKNPDGEIKAWLWRRVNGPESVKILDSAQSVATALFTDTGFYQFELKVTGSGNAYGTDTVVVTVSYSIRSNQPPVANAGPDKFISSDANEFTLDGSASSDADKNIMSYVWRQIQPGKLATITYGSIPSFAMVTGFEKTDYLFELTVTDSMAAYSSDTVMVSVDGGDCPIVSDRGKVNLELELIGNLSVKRVMTNTASTGDLIFFASGHELKEGNWLYGSSKVDIYNVRSGSWTSGELSRRRSDVAAVASGGKAFFAGGRLGDGAFDELFSVVDVYDIASNRWSVRQLSEPRAYIGAATTGGKVFFAGGEKDWNYNTSGVVDILDIASGVLTVSSLSEPRANVSAVTVDDKVYFAGGHREDRWYQSPSDRIDIYDSRVASWSTSNLMRPEGNVSGLFAAGSLYWIYNCFADITDVQTGQHKIEYFSSQRKWGPYGNQQSFFINGKVLIGSNDALGHLRFDIYDPLSGKWTIGILPLNISLTSMVANNNNLYLTGLTDRYKESSPVWKLKF